MWSHYIGAFIFICLIFYSLKPYYLPAGQKIIESSPGFVQNGHHTLHMLQTIYELDNDNYMCINVPVNERGLYEKYGMIVNLFASDEEISEEEAELLRNVDPYFASWLGGHYSIETLREFAKNNEIFINDFIEKYQHSEKYIEYQLHHQTERQSYEMNNNATEETNSNFITTATSYIMDEIFDAMEELQEFSTSYSLYVSKKVSRWPMIVFLVSAVYCLSASAIYHTFYVINPKISDILQTLDYTGISTLICGSYVPVIYYAFYCQPFYVKLYLSIVFLLNTITVIVMVTPKCRYIVLSCLHSYRSPQFRHVRALSFVLVANFAWLPIGHLYFTNQMDNPLFSVAFKYIAMMGFTYVLGAYFYARRVPERYFPGKFDFAVYLSMKVRNNHISFTVIIYFMFVLWLLLSSTLLGHGRCTRSVYLMVVQYKRELL